MKVKIVADSMNHLKSGVGNYTFNLIKGLKPYEINLTLINYQEAGNYPTQLYPNILKGWFLETHSWYLSLPFRIKNEVGTIIHNPSQVPTFFNFKGKNIITVHDLSVLKFPKRHKPGRKLITKLLMPRTLKKSNMIIAVSENTKKDLLNFFPFLEEEKIRVIYEAANDHFTVIQDDKILAGCRQQYHLPPEFVLYVGTLEPRKNLVTLLNAFSNVNQKKDIPLVITGKKGWKYKEIFKTFNNLKLEKKVFFTGYVYQDDLPALYNLATVFVYPSIYEGFGLPPLEAMQCGCPVITSNVSSLPEIVGDAAIKVNPFSVKALEEAIYRLVSNPELRKDYIHTGLKQAEKFSWDKCAQETFQVYQEVLNET